MEWGPGNRLREPEKQERSVERSIFAFGVVTIESARDLWKASRIVNLQDERQTYNLPPLSHWVNAAQVFPYSRLRHKPLGWNSMSSGREAAVTKLLNLNLVRIAAGTELWVDLGNVMRYQKVSVLQADVCPEDQPHSCPTPSSPL